MRRLKLTEKDLRAIISGVIKENIRKTYTNNVWKPKNLRMIREGLIMSYEPQKVMDIVRRLNLLHSIADGSDIGWMYKGGNDHTIRNGKYNTSDNPKTTRDINRLVQLVIDCRYLKLNGLKQMSETILCLNRCGYFLSCIIEHGDTLIKVPNGKITQDLWQQMCETDYYYRFVFEPKYDVAIQKEDIPEYCYHICELSKVEKILKNGLVPKALNRRSSHPERVYMFLWKPDNWKEIANAFNQSRVSSGFGLLRIDMYSWLNDKDNLNLYFDQNTFKAYPDAIYTTEPIPNNVITLIDTYKI